MADNGTMKTADPALSSFSLEDDSVIDLTETGLAEVTTDDFFAAEIAFEGNAINDTVAEQSIFEDEVVALEMQFFADLLMIEDSGAALDG